MADAKDFLFEIGTEEMPSAPLNNAVKQLGTMIAKGLDEAGLAHGEVRVISSPRRLAALVANVATATDEVHEVKRGPAANIAFDADGNATKAAQGFARKCGVAAEDLVRREDTDGREYVFAEKNIPCARRPSPACSGPTTAASAGATSTRRSCVRSVGSAAFWARMLCPCRLPT